MADGLVHHHLKLISCHFLHKCNVTTTENRFLKPTRPPIAIPFLDGGCHWWRAGPVGSVPELAGSCSKSHLRFPVIIRVVSLLDPACACAREGLGAGGVGRLASGGKTPPAAVVGGSLAEELVLGTRTSEGPAATSSPEARMAVQRTKGHLVDLAAVLVADHFVPQIRLGELGKDCFAVGEHVWRGEGHGVRE